jgi:hypothetical protein
MKEPLLPYFILWGTDISRWSYMDVSRAVHTPKGPLTVHSLRDGTNSNVQVGGIIASNVFFASEAPLYRTGYGVGFGLLGVSAAACTLLFFGVRRENRKRDRGDRDYRLARPDAHNLGDDHPHWRFTT